MQTIETIETMFFKSLLVAWRTGSARVVLSPKSSLSNKNIADEDEQAGVNKTAAEEDEPEPTSGRVTRLQLALEKAHPNHAALYDDVYLATVLAAPSKKDPKKPRSLAYARDKMLAALKWRQAIMADDLTPEKLLRPLACASLYWHGFDILGRPILWVRPIRKNWKHLDIEEEKQMHVLMIEYGIRQMPTGTTTFCVVADTKNLGLKHTNSQFLNALLAMITTGYPDRLGALYAGPVNIAVKAIFAMLSPLMPKRLVNKINLMNKPSTQLCAALGDQDNLPTFLGGTATHDIVDEATGDFSWEMMDTAMQAAKERLQLDSED